MSNSPEREVGNKYGAPMGRPTVDGGYTLLDNARPVSLRAVRVDSGGYDQGGAYWGIRPRGTRLYYFEAHVSDINGYIDATNREDAKTKIRALHPLARFYR